VRTIILALAVTLASSAPVWAQPDTCAEFNTRINALASGAAAQGGQDPVRNLLDIGQTTRCFADYVKQRVMLIDLIRRFESSRSDKQSGAGAGGNGTTSVVSQGPAAKVLSVAAEYGAVTREVNGQVITIRGNLAGLPSALVRKNLVPYCVPQDRSSGFCVGNSALGILRRFSFSTAFNAVQQVEAVARATGAPTPAGQPVVFDAERNQLASASLRFEWGQRDATSPAFLEKWHATVGKEMGTASAELSQRASEFAEPIFDAPAYTNWQDKHAPLIRAAGQDRARIVTAFEAALAELYIVMQDVIPDVQEKAAAALGAYNAFLMKQDDFIGEIATKKVWALEFTNNRPTSQPHTSNLRFAYDAPLSKKDKLVVNVAATWYTTSQANTDGTSSKYRDAQAALQYERGLGDIAIIGPATLSAAFYYQYQHAPALLKIDPLKPVPGVTFVDLPANAKTVFAEKGDIVLGQIKLSLTPKESSVKVPLAVTYSNRTELIDKPTWKAQLGVTYDFDSLFARGK
jgi:hypothetical protein